MKLIVSPVEYAKITINNDIEKSIGKGLLVYIGISKQDTQNPKIDELIEKIVNKLENLQVFVGKDDKINTSLKHINGEILLVSNFTVYGKNRKGNKIDFQDSGSFQDSRKIYNKLVSKLKENKIKLQTGEFGAYMEIESKNNGPLNYVLDFI